MTHAEDRESSIDFLEALKIILLKYSLKENKIIEDLIDNIYPIELFDGYSYKKFGIKEIFNALYQKFKIHKINKEITPTNLNEIQSVFIEEINSREKLKAKLSGISKGVKTNFKFIASFLENSPFVKTTALSIALIKIISKIYDYNMTTKECLDYIEKKGYTNESKNSDSIFRFLEKTAAFIFYKNGPAAKQFDFLAENLIKEYIKKLNDDRKYYGYLNNYNNAVNYAIESLKEISD